MFASADEINLSKDTSFGFHKSKGTIKESGDYVQLMIFKDRAPYRTILTVFVKRNGFGCLTIADDLR